MMSKMESMYYNQAWNLVEPPEGIKPSDASGSIKKESKWQSENF